MTNLSRAVAKLEERLENGWRKIDEAERAGRETVAWVRLWLSLLNDYERTVDALRRRAGEG